MFPFLVIHRIFAPCLRSRVRVHMIKNANNTIADLRRHHPRLALVLHVLVAAPENVLCALSILHVPIALKD